MCSRRVVFLTLIANSLLQGVLSTPDGQQAVDQKEPSPSGSVPASEPQSQTAAASENAASNSGKDIPDYKKDIPDYKKDIPAYKKDIPDYKNDIPDVHALIPNYKKNIPSNYSKYIPDFSQYLDVRQYLPIALFIEEQHAPAKAKSCHNLGELDAWKNTQEKILKKYVPKAYQHHALKDLDRKYTENQARINKAAAEKAAAEKAAAEKAAAEKAAAEKASSQKAASDNTMVTAAPATSAAADKAKGDSDSKTPPAFLLSIPSKASKGNDAGATASDGTVTSNNGNDIPDYKKDIPEYKKDMPNYKKDITDYRKDIPDVKALIPSYKKDIPGNFEKYIPEFSQYLDVRQYLPIAMLIEEQHAPAKAKSCHTLKELDAWRDAQEKSLKKYVPKDYQHYALKALAKKYTENKARITKEAAAKAAAEKAAAEKAKAASENATVTPAPENSVAADKARIDILTLIASPPQAVAANDASDKSRGSGFQWQQFVPDVQKDIPDVQKYIPDYKGSVPTNYSKYIPDWEHDLRVNISKYVQFARFMQSQHGPSSAKACDTTSELNSWRSKQETILKKFVPKPYQQNALNATAHEYTENLARIHKAAAAAHAAATNASTNKAGTEKTTSENTAADDAGKQALAATQSILSNAGVALVLVGITAGALATGGSLLYRRQRSPLQEDLLAAVAPLSV